jgi:DNA-binding transcriptional MerR regulator
MRITELARLTGLFFDQIRYVERKGYVKSRKILIGKRRVRDYTRGAVNLLGLIANYVSEGYKYDVAFPKATTDLANSRLL